MYKRFKRLLNTFVAKKYVAWLTATWLLVQGYVSGQEWVLLTAAIFALDLATKIKSPYQETENVCIRNIE